jgi:predicted Zn-dependent peptidase
MGIAQIEEKSRLLFEINGISVYNIESTRFKTNTINIFFADNLNADSVALNALFPSVLRRGSQNYPDMQKINLFLEGLFGAAFDCGVVKKGERQILHFFFEYVADKYVSTQKRNFEQGLDFLLDIIYNPVLENDSFINEYVDQEKNNLKMFIESRANDKMQYAIDRCYEVMCQDEPFGLYEYGSIEQIDDIRGEQLYQHYRKAVSSLPTVIFITGELIESDLKYLKEKLNSISRLGTKRLYSGLLKKYPGRLKTVEEPMEVTQGKLSIGFRTQVSSNDHDYYALLVYNGILGGGTHSKLFQNVREKAGLAYYAFAGLEKFKGLMIIASGIDIKNKDIAYDIIIKQLEAIKKGDITDYEFEATIKSLETGVNSLKDSQLQVVDFYLSQLISKTNDTLDSLFEKLKRVTKKDVIKVSKKIQLDTVYFLTAK